MSHEHAPPIVLDWLMADKRMKKEQFFAGCVYAILSNSNDFGVVVDEKQIINQAWKMAEMMAEKIETTK